MLPLKKSIVDYVNSKKLRMAFFGSSSFFRFLLNSVVWQEADGH
jgi:hypothetical protein